MKKFASLVLLGAVVTSGAPSLFAMMDSNASVSMDSSAKMEGTMMKSDSAMMMKKGGMMKMDWSKQSVVALAVHLGYKWKTDRSKLAKMAGIMNYRGTVSQNLKIKSYLLGVAQDAVMVGGAAMIRSRDIVDNAVLASNVTTVVAAVQAAGLVDTLKSAGPFTVFAPTNSAFEKLPAGTVDTLLKPENKGTLVDILTYHVVSGRYTSADLTDGLVLTTVEGKKLTFTRVNGKLMINGSAMVETADVISTNGVTHVIDSVLLPPK